VPSFACVAAASGRGSVLKLVSAERTAMLDDSMLNNLVLLVSSPVESECRNSKRVQARTRDSTRDANELERFFFTASDAYSRVDFVHEVSLPMFCAAFCSEFAAPSVAPVSTDAVIVGRELSGVFESPRCSPITGKGLLAPFCDSDKPRSSDGSVRTTSSSSNEYAKRLINALVREDAVPSDLVPRKPAKSVTRLHLFLHTARLLPSSLSAGDVLFAGASMLQKNI
jgi:hypothetical protein